MILCPKALEDGETYPIFTGMYLSEEDLRRMSPTSRSRVYCVYCSRKCAASRSHGWVPPDAWVEEQGELPVVGGLLG